MNTIFPNNTPLGPPSTTLGGGFTLTEQAVRQFEGVLEPKWDNIQDIPADLAPSGRVRISETTGATEVQDEAGTVSLSLQGGKASGKLLDSGGAVVNVRAFGAVGDGVVNDTAAFLAAFDVSAAVFAPPGTYRISSIDFANKSIYGAGRFLTTLIGDGDLLTNAQACSLHDLAIQNDVTGGKLVSLDGGANLGRSFFERVEFGQANYHTYLSAGSAGVTDWVFENCRFGSAQIISRYYFNCWAFRERGCYTWYNKVGLRMEGGSSMQISDSVFEYNKAEGVQLVATNNAIDQIAFRGVHFESNGNVDGTAQVLLSTEAAVRIRAVSFVDCAFYAPHGPVHVAIVPTAGGNISGISVFSCYSQAGLLLPDNAALGSPAIIQSCDFNGAAAPLGATVVDSALVLDQGMGTQILSTSGNVNETLTVSARGTCYELEKNNGAGGTSSTTFNITGVPDADGSWCDIHLSVSKDATGSAANAVATVQVHGTTLLSSIVVSGTPAGSTHRTLHAARIGGIWRVVGGVGTV